jgi:hypothetical protein
MGMNGELQPLLSNSRSGRRNQYLAAISGSFSDNVR